MEQKSNTIELQLFICTNKRQEGKECCQDKGALELRSELREWMKENDLRDLVKITASGCLGHCAQGIAAVLHPQNKWFTNVTGDHVEELKRLILNHIKEDDEKSANE